MNQNSAQVQVAYVNLYLSGYYHRAGKPGQFNVHPGDLYPTAVQAINDIDPDAPYVGTVEVLIPASLDIGRTNAEDSTPIPLGKTRAVYTTMGACAMQDYIALELGRKAE